MKIGLDVHGVIDAAPSYFALVTQLLIDNGHEVHVLTGEEDSGKLRKRLKDLHIKYTHLFSIVTYCKSVGEEVTYDQRGPWVSIDTWNAAKAKYCKDNGIDVHFDDSEEYGRHFETPYVFFKRIK